jgi:hypothetical protein
VEDRNVELILRAPFAIKKKAIGRTRRRREPIFSNR